MYIEPIDPAEGERQLKSFLLEGAKKLKAFCEENNVTITTYQTPPERVIRADFEYNLENDPEFKALCLDNSVDCEDPLLHECLYMGYRAAFIMKDFTAFTKHATAEITKYRKHHKKGLKHFEFRRARYSE